MITITAPSLEKALLKASIELACPIGDLEYDIVQVPSKGFLGFGKKEAILQVRLKQKTPPSTSPSPPPPSPNKVSTFRLSSPLTQTITALLTYPPPLSFQITP
uniref:Jag N-terminal domain-containing protein n=1 Tax=Helicobacter felis TaxID=214 RepID=UPI0018F83CDF